MSDYTNTGTTTPDGYSGVVKNAIPGSKAAKFIGGMNFSQLGSGIESLNTGDYGQAVSQLGGSMPGMVGAAFQMFGAADSLLAPLVKFKKMNDIGSLNQTNSFGGALSQVNKAGEDLANANKKGLIGRLFAKRKTNRNTLNANNLINKTNDVLTQGAMDLKQANEMESTLINQQQNVLSGPKTNNFLYKEGGDLGSTNESNIIPEGKLHAHKHHLKDNCDYLQEIPMSEKGIPVLAVAEDGTYQQHAEIERGELILTPEVTKEIMDLYKENSKESRIAAGKLLVKQLLYNTEDHTDELL